MISRLECVVADLLKERITLLPAIRRGDAPDIAFCLFLSRAPSRQAHEDLEQTDLLRRQIYFDRRPRGGVPSQRGCLRPDRNRDPSPKGPFASLRAGQSYWELSDGHKCQTDAGSSQCRRAENHP